MDPQVGGEFNLYDGKILGKNLELVYHLNEINNGRSKIRRSFGTGSSMIGKISQK